jgi:hypothetical protein
VVEKLIRKQQTTISKQTANEREKANFSKEFEL